MELTEIVDRLRRLAGAHGLDLDEFARLGRDDRLDDGELRDAWLIWGAWLNELDTQPA